MMIAWLRKLFRRRPMRWPRHLFIQIGTGYGYAGLVSCQEEASSVAEHVIGRRVMETEEVTLAHYWTTEREEDFREIERWAFAARPKETS